MRWLGLTLAVVVALSPAASAQTRPAPTKPAPSQPAAAADGVAAALRARDFAQAAERSQAALKQAPRDPRLWTLNGLALAGLGKRAEALRSFQRALAIDPNSLAALEGAAQAHYEAGSQRAVPLLERILKQRPDDPTAHAMQSTQPLPAERSLLPWLRQGNQPAAAAVVAVRRPLHLLTASRPDV